MHCCGGSTQSVSELQQPPHVGGHWPPHPFERKLVWQIVGQSGWQAQTLFWQLFPAEQLALLLQLVGQPGELPLHT